jgi:hypothetical protein
MKNDSPEIKLGDVVRVKPGVTDPDDPSIDWSGWYGRVDEIDPPGSRPRFILIDLDSVTLKGLPPEHIRRCEEQGLDWRQLGLYVEDVELAEARDTVDDVKRVRQELESQHEWDYLGEQGQRIHAIVGGVRDEWKQMQAWAEHLEASLTFPFEAEVAEWQERGPLRTGDILRVLSIEDVDDMYGVLVRCRRGRQIHHAMLADLEVTDRNSPNHQLVDDYSVWFANR